MNFKRIIGIDVSKNTLDVSWYDESEKPQFMKFDNSIPGLSQFVLHLQKLGCNLEENLICLENTGHYSDLPSRVLSNEGAFVWMVHPMVLKLFSPTLQRGKNDKTDAKKLCDFARNFQGQAEKFVPSSAEEDRMKDMDRLRSQLVKFRTQIMNMIESNKDKAQPCKVTDYLFTNLKSQFDQAIDDVDKELKRCIMSNPKYRRMYEILLSVPAIGPVCATQIIILTRGFTKITNYKAFACFIGTAPFSDSSGKYNPKPRVSNVGHKEFKGKIFMGALSQTHTNRFFHAFYQYGTVTLKKHHNSVMNALINEVLKLAFYLVEKDMVFEKEIYLSGKKNTLKFLQLS